MAPDYQGYLATELVSEQNTVTYRNLSRALKVHCNAAKCMLFEFHQKENKKRTGSVYATYLLAGTKKEQIIHGHTAPRAVDEDVPMPSSPPLPPSSFPVASQVTEQLEEPSPVPVKTISLCREDDLETVKAQFETITSIHIYSLSPGRIPDLQALTDNGRSVFADHHSKQDPLIHNKDYGIIQNPHVRRRKGKRPLNVNAPQPKVQPAKEEKRTSTIKQDQKKEDTPASRPSSRDSTNTQESTNKTKPSLKRDGSSLFKAFAKQGAKPKLERQDTSASAASSNTDAKMGGMDDEEGQSEDEAIFLDTGTTNNKKRSADVKKEKEERQAKLRKMMEDDEEEESEVPKVEDAMQDSEVVPAAVSGKDAIAPSGDPDNVDWSDSDTESKKKKEETNTEPKRRRGRRKVMKKRTVKDDEGFLVTREEEAWESFSEDEPAPMKKPIVAATKGSAPAKSSSQKSSAPKSTATAGKKKDIMSFFGKK